MDPEKQRSKWVQDEYDVDFRNLQRRALNPEAPDSDANALRQIFHFPRTLYTLVSLFTKDLEPFEPDFNPLWGLFDLNMTASSEKSLVELLTNKKLAIEQVKREAKKNSAMDEKASSLKSRYGLTLTENTEADASKAWKALQARIEENLKEMEGYRKHVNDIMSYSKVNVDKQVTNLARRHALVNVPEENAAFPIVFLPRNPNEKFYGREEELERISKFVDFRNNKTLRTYTIYGRRGVGKTNIAMEYAKRNPVGFDAIFWVSCETNLALRQSFSDMAVELGIPGADKNGRILFQVPNHMLIMSQIVMRRIK
ncbi:unnamed protein product [Sphagnum balticum]